MRKRTLQNVVGFSAIILLAALFAVVFFMEKNDTEEVVVTQEKLGTITFESSELVYDGMGKLDLMSGVSAKNADGEDVTDKIEAVITGDGTLNRKIVRYTLLDEKGNTVTEKRTLVMKNYKGPTLRIDDELVLKASDMKDLINVLKKSGKLSSEDGYGRDISSAVKCLREKKPNGEYEMEFSVVNSYDDSQTVTVMAKINGEVADPEIKLSEKEVKVRKGETFSPLSYVAMASDTVSDDAVRKIQVSSSVNTAEPGKYKVVYTLYSADKTAKTTATLKVSVLGE